VGIKQVIKANELMVSESDPTFYLKFTDINIGFPKLEEDCETHNLMPQECRIRDMSYAASIYVDLEYSKGNRHCI
jgi:DNA-directed RNA polymerase III subunit RPC2